MEIFNLIMWIIFIPWATWQGMDYLAECGEELDRMTNGILGESCERIASWFWSDTTKQANNRDKILLRMEQDHIKASANWPVSMGVNALMPTRNPSDALIRAKSVLGDDERLVYAQKIQNELAECRRRQAEYQRRAEGALERSRLASTTGAKDVFIVMNGLQIVLPEHHPVRVK